MSDKQDISKKKLVDLRVVELKVELENRSLDKTGVKSALIKRLKKALEEEGHDPDEYLFESEAKKDKDEQPEKEDDSLVEAEDTENDISNEDKIQLSLEAEEETLIENEGADEQQNEEKSTKDDDEEEEEEKEDLDDHVSNKEDEEEEEENDAEAGHDKEMEEKEKESAAEDEDKEKAQEEKVSNGVEEQESEQEEKEDSKKNEDQKKKEGSKSPVKKTPPAKTKIVRDEKGSKKPSSRNLWVSGLASGTKATDLKAAFSKHGKVVDAKIVTNVRSSSSKCYGFVTMSTSEEASKAIHHLNKTKLTGFNCVITVERTTNQPKNIKKISRADIKGSSAAKSSTKTTKPETPAKSTEKSTKPEKEIARDEDEIKMEDTEGEELLKDNEDEKEEKEEKEEKSGSKKSTSRPPIKAAQRKPVSNLRQRSNYAGRGVRGRRVFVARNYAGFRRPAYENYAPASREMGFGRRDDGIERRMREEERIRSIEYRQRLIERKQREETERLERERERLRIEKERLIRQKAELLQAEKEKQRLEREVLEREKEELRRREQLKSASLKRPYPKETTWESRKKAALSSRYEGSTNYGEGSSSMRYGNAYESSSRDRYPAKAESRSTAASGYSRDSRDKRDVHDHRSSARSNRTKMSGGGRSEEWKDRRVTSDSRYSSSIRGGSGNWPEQRWPDSRGGGKSTSDWNKWPSSSSTRAPMTPLYGSSLGMVHSSAPSDYGTTYDRSTLRRY